MKVFYLAVTVGLLLVLVFLNTVTIATTVEEVTAMRMSRAPDSWHIVVVNDDLFHPAKSEQDLKRNLLGFFEQAGIPSYRRNERWILCLLVAFGFGVLGCIREWRIAKAS